MLVVAIAAVLAACASGGSQRSASGGIKPARPGPASASDTDGPGLSPPTDLASIPDAEPTIEPLRSGPMRPYEVLGRSYTPITDDLAHSERGLASWYGRKFHGRPTASGERYDMYAMTAAHPTLPLPSYVRVRNPANQREVIVRVNDRGPFHVGRIIDLSYTAAFKLDLLRGVAPVEIERITASEIQAGTWRRGVNPAAPPAVAAVTSENSGWVRRPRQVAPVVAAVPKPDLVALTPGEPTANAVQEIAQAALPLPVTISSQSIATPMPVAAPAPFAVTALPSVDPARVQLTLPNEPGVYWVQLGAFRYRDGAEKFQRQVVADLGWIASALSVRSDADLHRLQAGPYADRDQAADVAQRLRSSLQLVPVIVERR